MAERRGDQPRGICRLCRKEAELQKSHVFPGFVIRWLKNTSATGYLRNTGSSQRMQEGPRERLLCSFCEQILSRDEKHFAENIFVPYHDSDATKFEYSLWLKRFLAGLHWKLLAIAEMSVCPPEERAIYSAAEEELRLFLLEQNADSGRTEFHLFFGGEVSSASGELSRKMTSYLARSIHGEPICTKSGVLAIHAKLARVMSVAFVTPRDRIKEEWIGTQVGDEGILTVPQEIRSTGLGPYLNERALEMEEASKRMPEREKNRISNAMLANPRRALASDTYRTHVRETEFNERLAEMFARDNADVLSQMKGRDRNQLCPCKSGQKYKKCHGS